MEDDFSVLVKLGPENAAFHCLLGDVHATQLELAEAEVSYQQCVDLAGDKAEDEYPRAVNFLGDLESPTE